MMSRQDASETLGMLVKQHGLAAVLHMIARGCEHMSGNEESSEMADALQNAADSLDDVVSDLEAVEEDISVG